MTRKTPYKHPVKNHVRSGAKVRNYERGKGKKPKVFSIKRQGRGGVNYGVQIFHAGGSERYNVAAGTYVGALKTGLNYLQDEGAPYRVHLTRGG